MKSIFSLKTAILVTMVLCAGYLFTGSPSGAQSYGNVESAIVQFAGTQPRVFWRALKETVVEVVPPALRPIFRSTLKEKLGLAAFPPEFPVRAVDALGVVKEILDETAVNSEALFAAIIANIEPILDENQEGERE